MAMMANFLAEMKSRHARPVEADMTLGQLPPASVGVEMVNKLAAKGFVVISPSFKEGTLEKAVEEIHEFDDLQRWYKVHHAIQEGILGIEGSSQIAELESPDLDDEVRSDGEVLMKLDFTMTHLGFEVGPYLNRLGFEISHRTFAVVSQAGEPPEETAPLNEKQAMKWLASFLRHRLMVVIYLGPMPGTMELNPYAMEETDALEVALMPGTIVVLRPDVMSHKVYAPSKALSISCFFLQGHIQRKRQSGAYFIPPAARDLDAWVMQRLQELKEQPFSDPWDMEIPRDFQSAMNHMYHKGQMIGVSGCACLFPMTSDCETFYKVNRSAVDYVVDVPFSRWDHREVYDDDLQGWRNYKTYCKHGAFMEGIELFDCKMFNMSANEAKSVDPHQRLILEVGYHSLHDAGLRKNTLVNSACGVYVGCGNSEWNFTPKEDSGAFGATGGALSIHSGRFSFTLGLKGPSLTLDTEGASGSTCLFLACESVQKKGRSTPNDLALAIGVHVMLSPIWWPAQCASGYLSVEGRCLTFNSSAAGYVRGDSVASAVVKCLTEEVEGTYVTSEADSTIGTIAGAMMNNNGKGAGLSAPHGPAEQETIAEAIRNANIAPFDVDAVEAHGTGAFLTDAIEVGSLLRAHRSEDIRDPLALLAVKSSTANQIEVGGITSFLKTLYACQSGSMVPNLHLAQANPHMDAFDMPCAFVMECVEMKQHSTFSGIMSRGIGGSNVFVVTWGHINFERVPQEAPKTQKDTIKYWPGGGGELDKDMRPTSSYTIVGTWCEWATPEPMEQQGNGSFTFTVTLGENRWECFQILLDGDADRVLHPGMTKAWKDFAVEGPNRSSDADGACWMIDGRSEVIGIDVVSEGPHEELLERNAEEGTITRETLATADMGKPGDQYRVSLHIAGKWRTVTWEKLATKGEVPKGKYYLSGDFNDWAMEEMAEDKETAGVFTAGLELAPMSFGSYFQIFRNKDRQQLIYPGSIVTSGDGSAEVYGPDDLYENLAWYIEGSGGTFTVTFQRSLQDADTMKVSWRKTDRAVEG